MGRCRSWLGAPEWRKRFFVKPLQRFSASLVGTTAAQLLTLLKKEK
jgi:hypothetical protein